MTSRKTYQITVERDGDWWLVRVPEIHRATQARRLDQVEVMARDLIAVILDVDENSFDLTLGWDLKAESGKVVAAALESRIKAKIAQVEASNALRQAARKLTADGLTVRDAGALLDVSYQRIQQLLEEDPSSYETIYTSAISKLSQPGVEGRFVYRGGSIPLGHGTHGYAVAKKASASPGKKVAAPAAKKSRALEA